MMIYRKRNNGGKARKVAFVTAVLVVVLFGFLNITFPIDAAQGMMAPAVKLQASVQGIFSPFTSYFSSKRNLAEKIAALEDENAELSIAMLRLQVLESENAELRSLREDVGIESASSTEVSMDSRIAFSGIPDDGRLFTKILTRPPFSPYDTITIDMGKDDGVTSGKPLFYRDVLVGHVAEVSGDSSIATLITAAGIETDVRIMSAEGTVDGTAIGQGGGRLSVTLPKDVAISAGDVIVLPDTDSSIVGTVSYIEVNETDSFQVLYVGLPVALSRMMFLEVR